jgi:hypothetical protein
MKIINEMPYTIYMTQNPEQLLDEAFALEPGEELETELTAQQFYIGSYQGGLGWVLAAEFMDMQHFDMNVLMHVGKKRSHA